MVRRAWRMGSVIFVIGSSLSACPAGSDPSDPTDLTDPNAGEGSSSNEGVETSDATPSATDTNPGEAEAETTSQDTGPNPEPQGVSVHLFNVVRAEIDASHSPLPELMHRVELPPRITALAEAPAGTGSVVFDVDGTVVTDAEAPFLASQEGGAPADWGLDFGAHSLRATAFAGADGTGEVLGETAVDFTLSALGMNEAFEPLLAFQNAAWVMGNLDIVMEPRTFESAATAGEQLPYHLFTPEFYDAGAAYPLVIYLHGRGERGFDNRTSVYSNSALFRGARSLVSPNFQAEFPSFVLAPQCGDVPAHQEWAHWIGNSEDNLFAGLNNTDGSYMQHPDPFPSARMVSELIPALQTEFNIDPTRIYLVGESMGGFGTWEFTSRWPELFAAGVPMAGYSDRNTVPRILDIPFWVFHGEADESNPLAGSQIMAAAINDAGGSARLTTYPDTGHVETFSMAWDSELELLPWIFSQRKE